jgi:hemerythrin superfamily protein
MGPAHERNRPLDAIELIERDHRMFRDLFGQYEDAETAEDDAAKRRIVTRLLVELTAHEKMEEDVFFPELRQRVSEAGEDDIDEGLQEHHVADLLMDELRDLSLFNADFKPKMRVLRENVEHHLGEEEDNLLPRAKKLLSRARSSELGSRMEAVKQRAIQENARHAAGKNQ